MVRSSRAAFPCSLRSMDSEEYIEKNVRFLELIGTPTQFSQLGIEPTEENLEQILAFIFDNVGIDEPALQEKIRKNFARVMK